MTRFLRWLTDCIFGYSCAISGHADGCRIMNWWCNTVAYEKLWRYG